MNHELKTLIQIDIIVEIYKSQRLRWTDRLDRTLSKQSSTRLCNGKDPEKDPGIVNFTAYSDKVGRGDLYSNSRYVPTPPPLGLCSSLFRHREDGLVDIIHSGKSDGNGVRVPPVTLMKAGNRCYGEFRSSLNITKVTDDEEKLNTSK
ncbi:hypothetical protein EVAR_11684_1 [Eumeta japonica]|uniref:Uncharacterized protein n=1 Tax=Eumeta variegata TaxID=151549 RepID=A0A4C1U4R5_EUMVA|nr:hypothetical protein EVAR_11684_1 [Eumeta japonica]